MFAELQRTVESELTSAVDSVIVPGTQAGFLNYNKLFIKINKHLRKINAKINRDYTKIAKKGHSIVKQSYDVHREQTEITLKDMGARKAIVKEENAPDISVTFRGTPSDNFNKHLERMFREGRYPEVMIKSLSKEHVAMIENKVMKAISQGKGFNWVRDDLIREILPGGPDDVFAKSMGYKIERISRTTYREAVNFDMTDFVSDNPESFYGSRRVADGRPCTACIVQDGKFYPPGAELVDHPNGMCILVPLVYPEEYLLTGKVGKVPTDDFPTTLLEDFYGMGSKEQTKILGKAMFTLWQVEKFDLRSIVASSGSPLPYYKVAEDIEKYGGMSAPKSLFSSSKEAVKLNPVLDPADRKIVNSVIVPFSSDFVSGKTRTGLSLTGDGSDLISSSIPEETKAQLVSKYNLSQGFEGMFFVEFNDFAREIGIYTRKSENGMKYLVITKKRYESITTVPPVRFA